MEPVGIEGEAASRVIWDVGALLLAVSDALAARFAPVTVRGEVSAFTRAASGHCYFSLKDGGGQPAVLRCAMFRRAASLVDFMPAEGQLVELRGRLAVYEGRGELQMVVESMRRVGAGALYEEFIRLRERLGGEGLFDAARKRTLSPLPSTVGVIGSLAGAALHDVLSSLQRRAPHVRAVVYPSLVQGPTAPPQLVAALAEANRRREVQTLLLVRGGGSLEDLWAFNDERVVRAIVGSALPVVCGVGHETDVTLADLAADLRAPTPTAAAELAAAAQADMSAALSGLALRLQSAMHRRQDAQAQRVDALAWRLGRPTRALALQATRLDMAERRLRRSLRATLDRQQPRCEQAALRLDRAALHRLSASGQRLATLDARLSSLDPRRVLERGFAWVEDDAGRAVVSAAMLQPGDRLTAVWADGRANARVTEVRSLPEAD